MYETTRAGCRRRKPRGKFQINEGEKGRAPHGDDICTAARLLDVVGEIQKGISDDDERVSAHAAVSVQARDQQMDGSGARRCALAVRRSDQPITRCRAGHSARIVFSHSAVRRLDVRCGSDIGRSRIYLKISRVLSGVPNAAGRRHNGANLYAVQTDTGRVTESLGETGTWTNSLCA